MIKNLTKSQRVHFENERVYFENGRVYFKNERDHFWHSSRSFFLLVAEQMKQTQKHLKISCRDDDETMLWQSIFSGCLERFIFLEV